MGRNGKNLSVFSYCIFFQLLLGLLYWLLFRVKLWDFLLTSVGDPGLKGWGCKPIILAYFSQKLHGIETKLDHEGDRILSATLGPLLY